MQLLPFDHRRARISGAVAVVLVVVGLVLAGDVVSALPSASLYAIDVDGGLWLVSTKDASAKRLGETGVVGASALEFGPDGRLYAISWGDSGAFYRIDPATAVADPIGSLGVSVFEGSLVFAPDGTVYATNEGDALNPHLFVIDPRTGVAKTSARLDSPADINAAAWRGDGTLIGLDRERGKLVTINPATGKVKALATVPGAVGSEGGMTLVCRVGYFVTGGSRASEPGGNALYSFDLRTGASRLIGRLPDSIGERGASGLAGSPMAADQCGPAPSTPAKRGGGKRKPPKSR